MSRIADYQKMYYMMFNAMTDAIKLLQKAQQTAEEVYTSGGDAVLHIVSEQKEESDDQ